MESCTHPIASTVLEQEGCPVAKQNVVKPPDISHTEYIYARVHFDPQFQECLLGELPELIFYKYANSRSEARQLVRKIDAMAAELYAVADNLDEYLVMYETPKWED